MAPSAEGQGPEKKPVPPSEFGPGSLMTSEEVRNYLNISRTQLWRLVKEEGFPALKVGGDFRYRKAEIDAWLEAQRHVPNKRAPKEKE